MAKPRQNEYNRNSNEYRQIRRNALRLLGFCPSCSNPLLNIYYNECDKCRANKKIRNYKNTHGK